MAKTRKNFSNGQQNPTRGSKAPLFLMLGGALLLIVVAFFAFQKKDSAYTAEVTGRPNLTVNKEQVDLGDVKLGDTVEVSFELKNTGDKPLKFSKAPYVELIEGC